MIILYFIAGLLAGIIGGMGMGGGTVLIPILTIFFEKQQIVAQGVNILSFVPMAAVALVFHIKNKLVKFKNILLLIIPACLCSALGALLARGMDTELLGRLFGGFLIALAVFQAVMAWKSNKV